jgi:hypothetical protein
MTKVPSWLPKCPVCGETLQGCGFPLPAKGRGFCPGGGGPTNFEAEVDTETLVKDKNGNLAPQVGWKVDGNSH